MNYWLTNRRVFVFYVAACICIYDLQLWGCWCRLRSRHTGGDERGKEETGVEPQEDRREKQMRGRERRGERIKGRKDGGSGERAGERQSCEDVRQTRDGETGRQREAVSICELLISRSFTILNLAWPEGSSHQWQGRERERGGGRERNGEIASRKNPPESR